MTATSRSTRRAIAGPAEAEQWPWRRWGRARRRAHVDARCAPRRGCARARWSRSAAATARCWPSWRGPGRRRASTASSSRRPAIEIARARGIPRAGRLEAYDGARVPAEDGAYDLACSRTCSSTSRAPAPLLAEAARVARSCSSRCRSRTTARRARPGQAARRRASATCTPSTAPVQALVGRAGLQVVGRARRPAPHAHHAFFADGRSPSARRGSGRCACGACAPASADAPSGSSPSTTRLTRSR